MATNRSIIKSEELKPTPLPLSQAVLVDKTLYISGQLGLNKEGIMASGVKSQTKQTLDNIGHILEAAGASFKNIVKVTVLLADIKDFMDMNEVYGQYFQDRFPARMAYQVACLPLPGALVEIEAVAIVGPITEL